MHFLCLIDDSACCKNIVTVFLLFRLYCGVWFVELSEQSEQAAWWFFLSVSSSRTITSHQRDQGENLNETTFSARLLIWLGSWGGTDCCSGAFSEAEKYPHVPLNCEYRDFSGKWRRSLSFVQRASHAPEQQQSYTAIYWGESDAASNISHSCNETNIDYIFIV